MTAESTIRKARLNNQRKHFDIDLVKLGYDFAVFETCDIHAHPRQFELNFHRYSGENYYGDIIIDKIIYRSSQVKTNHWESGRKQENIIRTPCIYERNVLNLLAHSHLKKQMVNMIESKFIEV